MEIIIVFVEEGEMAFYQVFKLFFFFNKSSSLLDYYSFHKVDINSVIMPK